MKSILIVDDEVSVREFLRTALSRYGYDVTAVAHTGQVVEALSVRAYDLVIVDAHVRGALGVDLVRRIRSSKNAVPVVVYTGGISPEEEVEFRAAGAQDVILKGLGLSVLTEKIAGILSEGKASEASAPPRAAVRTILVTDDDPAIRRVLRRFLESRHFSVVEADSGREAVDAVRKGAFAAAFLDVNMPGELDGIAALQEIHSLRPELGVIMVSGEQDDRTVGRAVELGAAGYVVKPFDFLYLELMLISRLEEGPRRS